MKTKIWAMALILLIAVMNAFAQLALKKASSNISFSLIFNPWFITALFTLVIGFGAMIIAFKGGDLTALYPLMATTYIWLTLFAIFFLGETVSIIKWAGIGMIVLGVSLIGGSR